MGGKSFRRNASTANQQRPFHLNGLRGVFISESPPSPRTWRARRGGSRHRRFCNRTICRRSRSPCPVPAPLTKCRSCVAPHRCSSRTCRRGWAWCSWVGSKEGVGETLRRHRSKLRAFLGRCHLVHLAPLARGC